MKNYTVKRKIGIIISWFGVALCMGLIFYLSNQPSVQSAKLSHSFLMIIWKFFKLDKIDDHIIRKIAHASEYFVLESLLFISLYLSKDKTMPVTSIIISVLYCISDEIHQIFIPGRAFMVKDILIDTSGAVISLAIFLLFFKSILPKIQNKKLNKIKN